MLNISRTIKGDCIYRLTKIAAAVLLLSALTGWNAVHAKFLNLGTLDVRPVTENTDEWFIEYLQPGAQKTQQIQISNFSAQTKNLSLYVADSLTKKDDTGFYVKGSTETSSTLKNWVHLPTNSLSLNAGESVIVSINFSLPQNAGVGLHTGAVMVRENIATGKNLNTAIAMEKGVRIYLNVTGTAITEGSTQSFSRAPSFNSYGVSIATQNAGTTDYHTTYQLELRDIWGNMVGSEQKEVIAQPESTSVISMAVKAPALGIVSTYLYEKTGDGAYLGSKMALPLWLLLTLLSVTLFYAWAKKPQTFTAYVTMVKNLAGSIKLQRGIAYFGMLGMAVIGTLYITDFDPDMAKSQLLAETSGTSYELTVKWGNFRKNVFPPNGYRQEWHGRLYFPNARVQIMELLDFERNDQAEIVGDRTALRFDALTGPDNDGIVLKITATGEEVPVFRYENFETETVHEIKITDLIDSPGIYPNGIFATWIKADYSAEEKMRLQALQLENEGLQELEGTSEIEASPSAGTIPELKNLFIEELPATPEALTNFILQSDYVSSIVEENEAAQVETDSILIEALEATPEVLQEVAATPDLNFVFIPSESITFPPQEFSFDEDRVTVQDLGTIIFVQNKETPWNTYISTTDFQLLSGNAVIPASALKIIPGNPTVLTDEKDAVIRTGGTSNFASEMDKSLLVNVNPKDITEETEEVTDPETGETTEVTREEQGIFVLNPKLEFRIPKGTPAGTYMGSLTITSL